jgi:hypothetical protein
MAARGGKVASTMAADCHHLHETTSRYDAARRRLTFLLVCPACGVERIVETMHYEPRFVPSRARS